MTRPRAGVDLARIEPASLAAWRAWLERHHQQSESVWLVIPKKASKTATFTMTEAAEEALCFGWIDSLPRALDETRSMLLMSPRKKGSSWSAVNKRRVEKLIAEGRMAAPGLARIAQAKEDGTWDRLNDVDALIEPQDLLAALAAHPEAMGHWRAFPKSARRGILEWISTAKTAQTRAKRIVETAARAALNERANQWTGRANPRKSGA